MSKNPLTLTRQTLYELVWSKPMSDLAKEFNMSDVGLAKRCRAVEVPIPYRGYWARKAAGQEPPTIPMPKYRGRTPPAPASPITPPTTIGPKEIQREGPEPHVHFALPTDTPPPEAPRNPGVQVLQQRIAALQLIHATAIADTCAIVRRTAKHEKLPDRASLRFTPAERAGCLVHLNVSKDTLSRALLLADRFIRTAEAIHWPLTDPLPREAVSPSDDRRTIPTSDQPAPPEFARLLVDGEPISFLIQERCREEPREPTRTELAREKREYSYHAPRINTLRPM